MSNIEQTEKTPLQIASDSIMERAKADIAKYGYFQISTCGDHSNWNKNEHFAMRQLASRGIEGLIISSQVRWGVTDWTIMES